jgi:NDP-sugar pyrophosphorylase family protein
LGLPTWYLRHKVFEALGDGRKLGVRIFYSVEEEPLGTAGAIKNAEPFITDDIFVILYGDVLTNLDLNRLVETLGGADGAIALVSLKSPYGIVEYDTNGYVTHFREKPTLEGFYINAGVYAFRRGVLKFLPERGT